MTEEFYKSINECFQKELQSWKTESYHIRQLVRVALFSASERMAEEFKRNNPEFDREKFVKAFSE